MEISEPGKILEPLVIIILIFFKEEDILDLLEQCEIDDEKLMGKTSKLRGPKVQYLYILKYRSRCYQVQ